MNWIIAFTTPIFLANSSSGVYFLFGSAALLTAIVCCFWMPETRGRSLEDIDAEFSGKHKFSDDEESDRGTVLVDMPVEGTAYERRREKEKAEVNVTVKAGEGSTTSL